MLFDRLMHRKVLIKSSGDPSGELKINSITETSWMTLFKTLVESDFFNISVPIIGVPLITIVSSNITVDSVFLFLI